MIHVMGRTYEVIQDHKNGWNVEAFKERYSEVLERYDYIVGDWGYNMLRLKGFFKETNAKLNKEASVASLQDYLHEYCNFGCAYFIVERMPGKGPIEVEDLKLNEE
ncbi:MAG TPA: YutD family protein [Bacilli bacterium]